jgi:hypothetical protein
MATAIRHGGTGLVIAVLGLGLAASASAQGTRAHRVGLSREEQKDFLDDLSNSRAFGRSSNDRRSLPAAPDLDAPTAEMTKLRPLLDEFANEISLLNSSLSNELSQNRTVSSLLSDSYMITADVLDLSKRAKAENDHQLLFDDLRHIDASWGELSHRLKGVRGLNHKTEDHVANLDDIASDIRKTIDISQQVNYRELSMKTIGLATDLENLIDDIQYELHKSQEGTQLTTSTSQAHQQVLQLADLSDDHADLQALASGYRRFQELWYPQAAKLQSQNREGFARSLRRIAQSDGEIAQLLLLQDRFDKTQIVYLTSALRKDITDFFYYATLDMCLKLPKAGQVMSTASEFYGVCDHFIDTVNNDAPYDQIIEAFRYIEQADRSFEEVFAPIPDNDAASALQGISQTLNALRTALQVNHDEFNRQAAAPLAAKIANLTDSIDRTSRVWLAHDRQTFSQQCLDDTDALAAASAKLQQEIVNGANLAQIRSHTEDVYQTWRKVYNYLIKCQTDERSTLGRYASQLTPALVDLRTQVAQ